MDNTIKREARYSLRWWKIYYHTLLYSHYILGILGVVIGALIAAGTTISFLGMETKHLGVLSTVIVGIVSFMQPGRMASFFFEAYTRLRIAVLRSESSPTADEDLITALEEGYKIVSAVQPEALRRHKEEGTVLDMSELSEDRKKQARAKLIELFEEQRNETKDDPPGG